MQFTDFRQDIQLSLLYYTDFVKTLLKLPPSLNTGLQLSKKFN